jgi:3-oxoadipate enol-lactonase
MTLAPSVVRVGGHDTAVVDAGDGPPLVVLHSLGLDSRVVDGVAPLLRSSCRLIAYDLRSHGLSAAPPSTFDLERCAADLVELLDALQLECAHVAGFSLGGAIAQLAALAAPQRWFSAPALAAGPWYVDYARHCVRRASVAQWSGWWRSFATLDIADRIDAIGCPTTVVAGEHDLSTLPSEMAAMASASRTRRSTWSPAVRT